MADDSQKDPQKPTQPPTPPAAPAAPAGPTHYLAKAHLDVMREEKGKKRVVSYTPGVVEAKLLTPDEIASFTAQGVLEPVGLSVPASSE